MLIYVLNIALDSTLKCKSCVVHLGNWCILAQKPDRWVGKSRTSILPSSDIKCFQTLLALRDQSASGQKQETTSEWCLQYLSDNGKKRLLRCLRSAFVGQLDKAVPDSFKCGPWLQPSLPVFKAAPDASFVAQHIPECSVTQLDFFRRPDRLI